MIVVDNSGLFTMMKTVDKSGLFADNYSQRMGILSR